MSKAKELGASLLSQKRARDDKFRKRQESFQKRQAWAELLIPPIIDAGTRALTTSNIEEFDYNSALVKENQDYALALENAQTRLGINKRINEEFGGDAFQYYANVDREEAERRAAEALRSEGMDIYVGDYGPYKEQITKLVDDWAQENADKHNEAMALVRKIGTPEEYASLVKLNRGKARSDDLFGALFQKGVNYVRGTSQEELDARAIQSIANSPFARNADALNLFEKNYNKSRNVMKSYDFAKFATDMKDDLGIAGEKKQLWAIEDEEIQTQVVDGRLMLKGQRKWYALNNPERKFIQELDEDKINFNDYSSPEMRDKAADDIAREVYAAANFHMMAVAQLNPKAVIEFNERVSDESKGKLSLIDIEAGDDIVENLKIVSDIYSELSAVPGNLRSETMDAALKAQFDLINTEVTEMLASILEFKTSNPAYYKQRFDDIVSKMNVRINSIFEANKLIRAQGQGI
tara:strand:+ start:367 stop:1761 length:1395 start_codon:yes stop_codon:yes gene_type:complete